VLLQKDKKTERIGVGLSKIFLYCIFILFLTTVILISKLVILAYDLSDSPKTIQPKANSTDYYSIVCGQQINFFSTNAWKLQITGLSHPTDLEGRWSNGDIVRISFKMPKTNCRDSKIILGLRGFLYGSRQAQTANVSFNGENIGKVSIKSGEKNPRNIILDIPQNLIKSDELSTLVFHIKDPISPKSVGYNDDTRLLSFKFQTILFH
jgi:hypothetical protein